MARLYADENVPLPVVERLRTLGHDVLTVVEDGKGNQRYPDASVLHDAAASGRTVVTLNRRHFRRLHGESREHAGMVLCALTTLISRGKRCGFTRRWRSRAPWPAECSV